MTRTIPKQVEPAGSRHLSWREIMLGDGLHDGESVALRTRQFAEVNRSNISQNVVIMLAAMAVAYDNVPHQPLWLVYGYVTAVAVMSLEEIAPAALQQHITWGVLLAGLAIFGNGRWALDAWLKAPPR